ncbi:MAG: hypothetical protein JWR35_3720 [Marmoricola sp.]|nr:hypothetical protein [Marmoricola sp.]
MDRLAYDQTVSRLADEQSLPTWIQEADSHVAQSAERQHVLRDVPASKAEETDMRAREEAKRARYDLMRALAAFLSDEAAEAELLSFSLRYNAQNIPFEDRAGLVVGMFVHLQAPTGPAAVVAAVMAFLRGGDLAELHRALAI